MAASAILNRLRAGFNLTVTAEHGRLLVSPADRITDEARAIIRQHKDELLALLGEPANDSPPTILDRLAESIAREYGVSAELCLDLLDADDRRDIEGGDQAMLEAWRVAVRMRDIVRYRLLGADGKPMPTQSSVMPRQGQSKGELIEQLKREFGSRLVLM